MNILKKNKSDIFVMRLNHFATIFFFLFCFVFFLTFLCLFVFFFSLHFSVTGVFGEEFLVRRSGLNINVNSPCGVCVRSRIHRKARNWIPAICNRARRPDSTN